MDFDFNPEQYQLRDTVRSYLKDHGGPRQARASLGRFDPALWRGLCDLGLQMLLVPEQQGGLGLGMIDLAMVLAEFGAALLPAAMGDTLLGADVLSRFGSAVQQQTYLPGIAAGELRFAFAHTQDDAAPVRATGAGATLRLHGVKWAVPCAQAATHLLVSATDEAGHVGLYLCAADAIQMRAHQAVDPTALLAEVHLADTPAQALGDGAALQRLLQTSAFAASAQMVGISATALDTAVTYAKDRKQFDRAIGAFQAIKHKCADMFVALEGARSTAYFASWALQEDADHAGLAVSMAKAACGDASRMICNEALQIHGGVGFTWDFDIHFYMKRAKLLEYQFGDATEHREAVAHAVMD